MTSQPDESNGPAVGTTFALRPAHVIGEADGAWWPQSRRLEAELGSLLDVWPPHEGTIVRVLYSPPDWDDRPYAVATRGRRLKTGGFPGDQTHEIVLSLLGGDHRTLSVIPVETPAVEVRRMLDEMREPTGARSSRE